MTTPPRPAGRASGPADASTDPADAARSATGTAAFVRLLLDSEVVRFGGFVGRSGRRMPYFIDAGRFRTGRQLDQLGSAYAAAIAARFGDRVDVLFGPAYKGIPLAVTAGVALARDHGLDVGVCFDRKEPKDHGEGGTLIGHQLVDGDRVVIVEDVTTAGTSIRASLPMLRAQADVEVVGLVVGVDRRERGRTDRSALTELSEEFGLETVALATIDDIIAHLTASPGADGPHLGPDDLARIAAYRAEHGAR
ncbi:MAG: orotate phosphoribosyltransferase [Nitriliruptoraceae bacterium]